MNKSIIALLLLSSAAAFANEAVDEQANRSAFAGAMTRAEVQAGVAQARADGSLHIGESGGRQQASSGIGRSRAEVRSEAVQAARTRVIQEAM